MKSAGELMWWDSMWLLYTTGAHYDGTDPKGPNTPGGNQTLKSWVLGTSFLPGFGGSGSWTPTYAVNSGQDQIIKSNFIANVKSRGGKAYLGFYFNDYTTINKNTRLVATDESTTGPPIDWYNTARSAAFIQAIADLAGAAKRLGFAGIMWDGEGKGDSMAWNYNATGTAGATATETERRAKVRQFGVDLGIAIGNAFPGCEMAFYNGGYIPGGCGGPIQSNAGNIPASQEITNYERSMWMDLFDGMFENIDNLGNFYSHNAYFYRNESAFKNLDTQYWYDMNGTFAYLSRRLSNWAKVAPKFGIRGFLMTSGDGTAYYKPPGSIAENFAAARRWNMGGVIPVFHTSSFVGQFNSYDYTTGNDPRGGNFVSRGAPTANWRPGLNAAAAPPEAVVASEPKFSALSATRQGSGVVVSGRVVPGAIAGVIDPVANGAIRQVRVSAPSIPDTACETRLVFAGGSPALRAGVPAGWYVEFSYTGPAGAGETVTIRAEDTHEVWATASLPVPA